MHYSGDASITKFVVGAVWILDTLHVAFMCHILYYYLITNYGVPTSSEYVVWSFPASLLFSAYSHINILPLSPSGEVVGDLPDCKCICCRWVWHRDDCSNRDQRIRQIFYATTPFAATFVLAEVLMTTSLCVLLYDSVALAEFATSTWSTGSDFVIGKLYANSLLASLNTWQHLRSRGQVKRRHPYRPPHEHTAAFGGNKEFKG
ncbi:hypothetical protein EDD17DRAFT_921847 [Pisolithus thermaeus]|nr:hypothetical protein EDD17DRAFT_921847 [Pisolithus thermaeus]